MKVPLGATVSLGRDRYHLQDEMVAWCRENVGLGSWWNSLPALPAGQDWSIQCIFGRTTFWFKQDSDAVLFSLKWL